VRNVKGHFIDDVLSILAVTVEDDRQSTVVVFEAEHENVACGARRISARVTHAKMQD
jgi:phenylpyruvate tautomerase PptA (4-oxalocrotonate tautomerase family)